MCQKHSRSSIKLLGKDGGAATPTCLGLGCEVTGEFTDCFLPGDLQCHNELPARLFTPVAPPPPSSVSLWYLFIYVPSCASGDPKPQIPFAPQPILEALQATNNVGVFIYRAYDFNFSIKKSEQGWSKCALLCCCLGQGFRFSLWGDGRDGAPRLSHTVS